MLYENNLFCHGQYKIHGFDQFNSTTIYMVKILSNQPRGMVLNLLHQAIFFSVLQPYKIIP